MTGVPGVGGGPVRLGFGRGEDPQLRGVGLPHEHEPRGPELGRQVGVLPFGPSEVLEEPHPLVEWISGRVADQILHDQWHPAERPIRKVRRRRLVPGLVEQRVDHRVELGVDPFDPLDGRLDQFLR
jgi:hypothetical protein